VRLRRFSGSDRVIRGVVLGCALFILTAGAHTAAAGQSDRLSGALVLLPVMVFLSAALADRRRSIGWLTAYLLGAEALSHIVLTLALGHDGHALSVIPSAPMLVAHVLAAALAATLLHQADALWHRWLDFVDVCSNGVRLAVFPTPPWKQVHALPNPPAFLRPRERAWHARRGPPFVMA
jgi:hypothetical protein